MAITAEQRAQRAHSIGGSDAPAIVGASPWKTPLALWLEKVEPESQEVVDSLPMRMGTALEPVILDQFARETGWEVEQYTDTLTDSEHPFLTAHIDGVVCDQGDRFPEGLEAKWVAVATDEWGVPESDQVPPHVFIQCLHYLMLTGWNTWHVAVLFGSRDFRRYTIARDDRLIATLRRHELEFWQLVKERIAPPMTSPQDARLLFKQDNGSVVVATPEVMKNLEMLKHCKREERSYSQLSDDLIASIQQYMGEASTLVDAAGNQVATWRTSKPAKRFDSKAFQKFDPDCYEQFARTGEPVRRFLIK